MKTSLVSRKPVGSKVISCYRIKLYLFFFLVLFVFALILRMLCINCHRSQLTGRHRLKKRQDPILNTDHMVMTGSSGLHNVYLTDLNQSRYVA